MRIGLVITELHPGGAEKCLVNLAIYLKDQGHEVAVWELWPAPPAGKRQLTDRLAQHQISWNSGGCVRAWDFFRAVRWLRRELQAFQPDVVQSFLFHGNLAAAIASRGHPWQLFGGARVKQPQRSRQLLQRLASHRMQRLVCVSQSVKAHCLERERIKAEKLLVIPNGVPARSDNDASPALDPTSELADQGIPDEAPLLLYVGRLDPQKGIAPLLARVDGLLDALPEHHMVIIGDGPLTSELNQLRQASRRRSQIHLLGWRANVIQWMRRSELLFLPAQYEGMPNVVLEAMSVAKPVVVFDVEGVRELLGDQAPSEPQIVAAENFEEFIAALERMASDAELRKRCGLANHARVEEAFQLESQLAKYEELYLATAAGGS